MSKIYLNFFKKNVLAVVHESNLGSDGESLEVSPCTSDQMSNSSYYPPSSSYTNGFTTQTANDSENCYIPNVKMRQKANRRWSEVGFK